MLLDKSHHRKNRSDTFDWLLKAWKITKANLMKKKYFRNLKLARSYSGQFIVKILWTLNRFFCIILIL